MFWKTFWPIFAVVLVVSPAAANETYNYSCDLGEGKKYHLLVDVTKNVLMWRGNKYAITLQPGCAKYGWHAVGNGTAFDFCTSTKGGAYIDQPGQDDVECEQYPSERR